MTPSYQIFEENIVTVLVCVLISMFQNFISTPMYYTIKPYSIYEINKRIPMHFLKII